VHRVIRGFLPTLTTGITMHDGWEIDGLTQGHVRRRWFPQTPDSAESRNPIIPAGWPWPRRIPQSSTSPASLLNGFGHRAMEHERPGADVDLGVLLRRAARP